MILLDLLSLLLMFAGGLLMLRGMWDRDPDAPSVSGGTYRQIATPFWKQRSWFRTPRAFHYYATGSVMFLGGCALGLAYVLIQLATRGL